MRVSHRRAFRDPRVLDAWRVLGPHWQDVFAPELAGLLEEAIEEHHRGGAIAWIEDRLAAELDAGV